MPTQEPNRITIRGPLFDDPLSPRTITPLAALIATLARADRVTLADDLSQARAEFGLVVGWWLWR